MAKPSRGGKRGSGASQQAPAKPTSFTYTSNDGGTNRYVRLPVELVYSDAKDPNISAAARANLDAFEAKRKNAKVEYGMVWKADGTPVTKELRGGQGSVGFPYYSLQVPDSVLSHIHPRTGDPYSLGGTFSDGDFNGWAWEGTKTQRAVAWEGIYTISKLDNFDARGFDSWYKTAFANALKNYRSNMNTYAAAFTNGSIDQATYARRRKNAFNLFLVDVHNDLLANQNKYGYYYALERWS